MMAIKFGINCSLGGSKVKSLLLHCTPNT